MNTSLNQATFRKCYHQGKHHQAGISWHQGRTANWICSFLEITFKGDNPEPKTENRQQRNEPQMAATKGLKCACLIYLPNLQIFIRLVKRNIL